MEPFEHAAVAAAKSRTIWTALMERIRPKDGIKPFKGRIASWVVAIVAATLLILHAAKIKDVEVDATTVMLLALIAVPWLGDFVEKISVGVSGVSIEWRRRLEEAEDELAKSRNTVLKLDALSRLASGDTQGHPKALADWDWTVVGPRVKHWADDHGAANPYDLGPKNWERCLYDLGLPGGREHTLEYEKSGRLKYQ